MADYSAVVTPARPAGRLRQARQAQILAAAEQVFAAQGFAGATTAQIAAQATLPKANVHYYFGTKEKLYRAVLDDILTLWLDEADFWITADRPPREALQGYVRAKLLLARQRPEASRIYANELLRGAPRLEAYLHFELRKRVERLSAVMQGWMAAGAMRRTDPAHLLFCIWAMTQTYADFAVQIAAVLGKPRLDEDVFQTAAKTVGEMVTGFIGDTI